MEFADEVSQNARNNGRGRQNQDVIQRKPCSEETLDCVGGALSSCGVHFDNFANITLPTAGRVLTDHSFSGGWKAPGLGKGE